MSWLKTELHSSDQKKINQAQTISPLNHGLPHQIYHHNKKKVDSKENESLQYKELNRDHVTEGWKRWGGCVPLLRRVGEGFLGSSLKPLASSPAGLHSFFSAAVEALVSIVAGSVGAGK